MTEETRIDGRNVLITGGGGTVGLRSEEPLADRCKRAAPSNRSELDISEDSAVDAEFERARPDVVFNCAAFHNVEVCEREEDRCSRSMRAPSSASPSVARALRRRSCTETNDVFAGDRDGPYSESDAPSPRSIYALSKLAGEYAALAYRADALVVRSGGLTASTGAPRRAGNSRSACSREGESRGLLEMVADQRLSPTTRPTWRGR